MGRWNTSNVDDAVVNLISCCGSLVESLAGKQFKYYDAPCQDEIEDLEDAIAQYRKYGGCPPSTKGDG